MAAIYRTTFLDQVASLPCGRCSSVASSRRSREPACVHHQHAVGDIGSRATEEINSHRHLIRQGGNEPVHSAWPRHRCHGSLIQDQHLRLNCQPLALTTFAGCRPTVPRDLFPA